MAAQAKLTDLLKEELDREAEITRRMLERFPEGAWNFKPHEKSMPMGRLAAMTAMMPGWIALVINQDELNIQPPGGSNYKDVEMNAKQLVESLDKSVKAGREALDKTTDEFLLTTKWRLMKGDQLMSEDPRYHALRGGVLNHLAHHRGQLSVYLRLRDVALASIYGPTADEG